jgi:hypothetical protein
MTDIDYVSEAEETGEGLTSFRQSPKITLLFLILTDLNNVKLALEPYYIRKDKGLNVERDIIIIRARLRTLLFHLTGTLKRHYKSDPAKYDSLLKLISSKNPADLFEAIDIINDFLDEKRFTRLDLEQYDTTNVELVAKRKGF